MLYLAFLALAPPADWIPARWNSSDPSSLDLVRTTPVNCLLTERGNWSASFAAKAAEAGVAVLGVVRPRDAIGDLAARAKAAGLAGIVLEGVFDPKIAASLRDSQLPVVEMGPRTRLRFDSPAPILATSQGVWPGINAAEDGSAKAAPSGAPWIDTNSGFLRFVRAMTNVEFWIAYAPPPKSVVPVARYVQAIGDAAIVGGRWVITLEADFEKRLLARDETARKDWQRMGDTLRFFEQHRTLCRMPAFGKLAIVQDIDSGGLISGGILDMISVKHTPVRPVPGSLLNDGKMTGARMAVNVDPGKLDEERKEVLRRFTRGGNTLLTAPPGWKFPPQRENQITLDKEDVEKLDQIWREVNSMTGRHNLGARLFNVASVLSTTVGGPDGKPLVLQMVNYSDYPVENVAAHVLGKYLRATLLEPGAGPRSLTPYELEEGTGVDIDKVSSIAILVLE